MSTIQMDFDCESQTFDLLHLLNSSHTKAMYQHILRGGYVRQLHLIYRFELAANTKTVTKAYPFASMRDACACTPSFRHDAILCKQRSDNIDHLQLLYGSAHVSRFGQQNMETQFTLDVLDGDRSITNVGTTIIEGKATEGVYLPVGLFTESSGKEVQFHTLSNWDVSKCMSGDSTAECESVVHTSRLALSTKDSNGSMTFKLNTHGPVSKGFIDVGIRIVLLVKPSKQQQQQL